MSAPRRLLVPAVLAAVAVGGCGEDDDSAAADPEEADVAVVGHNHLEWDTERLEAEAGDVTVALTCENAVNHDFTIEQTDEQVAACDPGETAVGTVELDEGEYTYVCTVPGHAQRMRGTLIVR